MTYNSLFQFVKKLVPKVSSTELIALRSGNTSVDRMIFNGKVDVSKFTQLQRDDFTLPTLNVTNLLKKYANETVYVGDNWRDLEAAENANITPIFAEYGYVKTGNYPQNTKGFNIKNIREIVSFI